MSLRHPWSLAGLATVAALASIALTGCANGSTTSTGSPAAPGATTSAAPVSTRVAAATEADRILGTFRPPAGARPLTDTTQAQSLLPKPLSGPVTQNQVDRVRFWSVTGTPSDTVKTLGVPDGAKSSGQTSGAGPGGSAVGVTFTWPATPQLDTRRLQVAAASAKSGTILRVDAIVTWLPARPANTLIPATVTTVTMDTTPGIVRVPGQDANAYKQVSTSDPGTVRAIVSALNSAPVQQPGGYHCPMNTGAHMMLSFRSGTTGANDATATIETSGCATITVNVTGGGTATLTGGRDVATKVASLLKVPWAMPS